MDHSYHGLLAAILETAVDAIIVIDEFGCVQSANPATENLFGYAPEEVVGKNVTILMPTPLSQSHDQHLKNYRDTGERKVIGIGREAIGKRKDGTTFPVHLAVSEIEMEGQRFFAGIIRDITDLKEAQQQLTDLNEILERRVERRTKELHETQADLGRSEKLATLGRVSGGIAHEIRNPLNAVKTSVYFLMNAKSATSEKTDEHLMRIDRQVTIIDNVITALCDVAKLPDPCRSDCNISEIAIEVALSVSMTSSIEIIDATDKQLPAAIVDPNQISIVFRNLVRNARDAMSGSGTITIASDRDGDFVNVHVTDTGTGISPERLPNITEPLHSTKARGMGLGLALSKTILDKNQGQLKVRSEIGKGTTFTVILKAATGRQAKRE